MGMSLDLYVEDDSIESPFLSRRFLNEIIFGSYIKLNHFLSREEEKVVIPNSHGEIILGKIRDATFFEKVRLPFIIIKAIKGKISVEEINKLGDKLVNRSEKIEDRERDPGKFKKVLKKIEDHLILNSDKFPLVHSLYETKELSEALYAIEVKGVSAHVEGDLFYYDNYSEIKNKIHLKSYGEDFGKVDFYIQANPIVVINDKTYYSKSITKAKQFEEEFEMCYNFLDLAIKSDKKILWEFG